MPSFAFAENSTQENASALVEAQATSEETAAAATVKVPAADLPVQIGADLTTAAMEEVPFSLEGFTRAQKGSNRPINDEYMGYTYLLGKEPTDVALIAMEDFAVLYVNPDSFELLSADLANTTHASDTVDSAVLSHESIGQLKAYLIELDTATAQGTAALTDDLTWYLTTSGSFTIDGVTYEFNQELQEGYYYARVLGPAGADVTEDAALAAYVPTHADYSLISGAEDVSVVAADTGMAAFRSFMNNLDWSPLWVTLKTTGAAIVIVFILGLLVAWWSLRIPSRAQDIADSILTIPMVLPPTVCGFVLLLLLGKNTALGQWFIDIGFPLIFSWPATVLAAVVVSFPLMYRSARGAFESIDPNMLDAARTLGWSETRIFIKLMLPLAWSSIAAGTVLAFARALGEFGATLFLAGNYVGITRTIPIAIYFEWMNGNTDVALFWTVIIIFFSFLVILFINLWGRRTTNYRRKGDINA